MNKAIIYTRKSSEGEDQQVESLNSQKDALYKLIDSKYKNSLQVVKIFEESQSAKKPGRPKFNEMVRRLQSGEADTIVCWDLNRLTRNPVDGGMLIGLVQWNNIKIITPSKEYEDSQSLLMFVEVGVANQFIRDLIKNTKRGLDSKLSKGIVPIKAPVGYKNDTSKLQGQRTIIKDKLRFPIIRKMWDLMLTGQYSIGKILSIATNEYGLRQENGLPISETKAYYLFGSIFYTGKYYEYGGKTYDNGAHEPMITLEEYEKVQRILGRTDKLYAKKRSFPFTNLIRCACGCNITAEERYRKTCNDCGKKYNAETHSKCPECGCTTNTKVHNYKYYHCTKKPNKSCKQKAITEKELERQITVLLQSISLPRSLIEWALKVIEDRVKAENKLGEKQLESLTTALEQNKRALSLLSEKYLSLSNSDSSLLTDEEYKERKSKILNEQHSLEDRILRFNETQNNILISLEKDFDFAVNATKVFSSTKDIGVKREILAKLGSNPILDSGILRLDLPKPFIHMQKAQKYINDEYIRIEPAILLDITSLNDEEFSKSTVWGG